MKAWIITVSTLDATREYPLSRTRVISLISARKGEQFIKMYIEYLYQALGMDLEDQRIASKYNKSDTEPEILVPKIISKFGYDVYCYRKPFILRGQRSEVLNISTRDGVSWLKWQGINYTSYEVDPETHEIIEVGEEIPLVMEAPQIQLRQLFR